MERVRIRAPFVAVLVLVTLVMATGTVLAATYVGGSFIDQVRVARESNPTSTHSQAWVDIPGAAVGITIPTNTRGLILARYSAESACYNTAAVSGSHWCSVRILVRNAAGLVTVMQPVEAVPFAQQGIDFAFDSTNSGRDTTGSWESHSMDRSLGPLAAGAYRVWAQYRTTSQGVTLRLDDWSLTVEKVRV